MGLAYKSEARSLLGVGIGLGHEPEGLSESSEGRDSSNALRNSKSWSMSSSGAGDTVEYDFTDQALDGSIGDMGRDAGTDSVLFCVACSSEGRSSGVDGSDRCWRQSSGSRSLKSMSRARSSSNSVWVGVSLDKIPDAKEAPAAVKALADWTAASFTCSEISSTSVMALRPTTGRPSSSCRGSMNGAMTCDMAFVALPLTPPGASSTSMDGGRPDCSRTRER
mmetsp:Transcript_99555/g.171382  ORF Transcript_99555/g.171382 Transcript_99555/m.171382 type:complete len:222 (-) Transcript_99555:359-1024(-)